MPTSAGAPCSDPRPGPHPLFSVVIPLEFHRGRIDECLCAWTTGQTCAADQYELVVVAPERFEPTRLAGIGSLLRGHDVLLRDASNHDMGLCVAGAKAARGRILFFTESHCWPEPDALEQAERALREHPEWAGFSARSIRVTHNRLSEVEADMYEADIEHAMLHHPWRKILDQCFVVRRKAYDESGGFEAELGHFAEWLLAARFFRKDLQVGYVPAVRVHHYYIGDFREIEEFTDDFTTGQARFLARQVSDRCSAMFPEVPYWSQAGDWERAAAGPMIRLAARAPASTVDRAREVLRWLCVAVLGFRVALYAAGLRALRARWRLWWSLRFAAREERHAAMREYCVAVVRRCGARLLARSRPLPRAAGYDSIRFGEFLLHPAAGFHLREEWKGRPCRWSAPEAMVRLVLEPGTYRLRLSWLPVRPTADADPTFFWDGMPIPVERTAIGDHSATFHVEVRGERPSWLGWTCRRFPATGDERRLGLLMDRMEWAREGHPV